MNQHDVIAALELPDSCRIDRKIPKKLLVENGAPTSTDKKWIQDGIEEIQWLAALKPDTIGVAAYRDEFREYLEIAILTVELREGAKMGRLAELIHRAIPYPVFLLMTSGEDLQLSVGHLRWSQNEKEKTVLDSTLVEVGFDRDTKDTPEIQQAFRQSLSLQRLPHDHLHSLYQGFVDVVVSLKAARFSGKYVLPTSREEAIEKHAAMNRCLELEAEISSLRRTAETERQTPKLVALNLEIRALGNERNRIVSMLRGER